MSGKCIELGHRGGVQGWEPLRSPYSRSWGSLIIHHLLLSSTSSFSILKTGLSDSVDPEISSSDALRAWTSSSVHFSYLFNFRSIFQTMKMQIKNLVDEIKAEIVLHLSVFSSTQPGPPEFRGIWKVTPPGYVIFGLWKIWVSGN